MSKCPVCEFEVPDVPGSAWREVAHMQMAHPEVVQARLREAGLDAETGFGNAPQTIHGTTLVNVTDGALALLREHGSVADALARARYRKARARQHASVALGIVIAAAVIAVLVLAGFWVAHWVEERERCDGLSASLCRAVRESDSRECRAGEGCGRPVEGER